MSDLDTVADKIADSICQHYRIGHYEYFQGARAWVSERSNLRSLIFKHLESSIEERPDDDNSQLSRSITKV